jgi:hypothetical protein
MQNLKKRERSELLFLGSAFVDIFLTGRLACPHLHKGFPKFIKARYRSVSLYLLILRLSSFFRLSDSSLP